MPLKLFAFEIVVCQGKLPEAIDGETKLFIKLSLISLFLDTKNYLYLLVKR